MKLELVKNDCPHFPKVEMTIDKELGEHLNKWELTKYLNTASCNLLIGRPSSGKSTLMYNMFSARGENKVLRKCFNHIFLFMPNSSQKSFKKNIFEVLDEDKRFDELNYETMSYVMDKIHAMDKNEKVAIIFDDQAPFLKDREIRKMFKELIYNRRHLAGGVSIFFLVQSWLSIEKDLRKLFTNIFCFKITKSEMDNLITEVIEQHKDVVLDVMKLVFDKKYNFLFINTDSGRMFKNFDEIKFVGENEEEKFAEIK